MEQQRPAESTQTGPYALRELLAEATRRGEPLYGIRQAVERTVDASLKEQSEAWETGDQPRLQRANEQLDADNKALQDINQLANPDN